MLQQTFSIFNRQFRWQWAQHATPNQHCSGERGFVSTVLSKIGGRLPKSFFQTGFTSCQPQDQRRRFRSLVFFRLLWPTPRPNRCQELQLALPQLSITPGHRFSQVLLPVSTHFHHGTLVLCRQSRRLRQRSVVRPWETKQSVSVSVKSPYSRWAIDGEFKLGQPFQPAWILAHWFTSTLGGSTAPWSSSPAQSVPFPTQSPGSSFAVGLQFLPGMDSAGRRSRRTFPWTC